MLYFEKHEYKQDKDGNRRKVHRFCRLTLSSDLFGNVLLEISKGNVGGRARDEEMSFDREETALSVAADMGLDWLARGFNLVEAKPPLDQLEATLSGQSQARDSSENTHKLSEVTSSTTVSIKSTSDMLTKIRNNKSSDPQTPTPSGSIDDIEPPLEPDFEDVFISLPGAPPPPTPDIPMEAPPDLYQMEPLVEDILPEPALDTSIIPLLAEVMNQPLMRRPAHGDPSDMDLDLRKPARGLADHLHIETSNHLPVLLESMADRLAADPLPPLEEELIVIQSRGMSRWVTLELARRHGIAASLQMPFPARFLEQLATRVLGEEGEDPMEDNPFADRELLSWLIYRILTNLDDPLFAPLERYLSEDRRGRKRFQLAQRLAACFDDYQIYRREFIQKWEQGQPAGPKNSEHAPWQAVMWRLLVHQAGCETRIGRYARLFKTLASDEDLRAVLPRRVSFFAPTSLPRSFVRLIAALARHIPVHIYFISPTWHYWADIRSDKEQARFQRRFRKNESATRFMERGHPLLASMGAQGRDFFKLLEEVDISGSAWHTLDFVVPGYGSLLHALQSDVLEMIDRNQDGTHQPLDVQPDDTSIQIHDCHGPMREMEVLRDLLLERFAEDPELRPEEVLVLVPDIRVYAPYVQAVFGVDHEQTPKLPFSIADRALSREDPLTETLLRVLTVARSRLSAGDVLELLEEAAVRRRFDIGEDELHTLRDWVRDTRVRWGRDGLSKSRDFQLPEQDAHTWRYGIDRLMLGYAMGPVDQMVDHKLPFAGDTTGQASLLGRFQQFLDSLFRFIHPLRGDHVLGTWARLLTDVINNFFKAADPDEDRALQQLRDAAKKLDTAQTVTSLDEKVSLPVIRAYLERLLAEDDAASGFISGRITFCALKPMRTIPFKLVCIAGLNEGEFPRPGRPSSFDLIAADRQTGDRSPREDDRQLFLETLLAARDRLILTYVGRSIVDNSARAPSPVLSELLDSLDTAYRFPGQQKAADYLVTRHPLQAFSPSYFNGTNPRLFSYDLDNFSAAGIEAERESSVFIERPLEVGDDPVWIDLDDLIAFWSHPAKFFCTEILSLRLPKLEDGDEDAEPFLLSGLDRYKLHQLMLRPDLDSAHLHDLADASGILPQAELGDAVFGRERDDISVLREHLEGIEKAETHYLKVSGEGWEVGGYVDGIFGSKRIQARPATIKSKDRISAWIQHLLLFASDAQVQETLLLGLGKASGSAGRPLERLRLLSPINAKGLLHSLIRGYWEGRRFPLTFFERASFDYAEAAWKVQQGSGRTDPIKKAQAAWTGALRGGPGGLVTADRLDPYVALCWRGREPLETQFDDFKRWADAFWTPFFHSQEEVL